MSNTEIEVVSVVINEPILKTLHQAKVEALMDTLIYFNGNRSLSAKSLDVCIRTIRNMINILKEDEPELYALIPPTWNPENIGKADWRGYTR
jgi:hypothetical protein